MILSMNKFWNPQTAWNVNNMLTNCLVTSCFSNPQMKHHTSCVADIPIYIPISLTKWRDKTAIIDQYFQTCSSRYWVVRATNMYHQSILLDQSSQMCDNRLRVKSIRMNNCYVITPVAKVLKPKICCWKNL